ncbi:MAG: DUF167 domain-containing protein [Candidatus Nanoarchaeia archaeon]
MIIKIKVKPHSGKQEIEKLAEDDYMVFLKSEPENNEANTELLKLLRKYFKKQNIIFNNIKIIKGLKSRDKIIVIN